MHAHINKSSGLLKAVKKKYVVVAVVVVAGSQITTKSLMSQLT